MPDFAKDVIKSLCSYYESEGIRPDDGFHCKYQEFCNGDLARGMQCHVGGKYGSRLRVLVASLDCGGGGASFIKDRTADVVKDAYGKKQDWHMRGTYQALSYFYGTDDRKELVHYMAMTNTCKCCRKGEGKGSHDHLPAKYYKRCCEYSLAEIVRIMPEAILFQGKLATTGCWDYLSDIEGIDDPEVKASLRYMDYQDLHCYAVICIHPSARGRSMKRKVHFYNEVLPKIAQYVLSHPL